MLLKDRLLGSYSRIYDFILISDMAINK